MQLWPTCYSMLCNSTDSFAETMPDYVGNKDNAEQGGCLKHFLFYHFSLPQGFRWQEYSPGVMSTHNLMHISVCCLNIVQPMTWLSGAEACTHKTARLPRIYEVTANSEARTVSKQEETGLEEEELVGQLSYESEWETECSQRKYIHTHTRTYMCWFLPDWQIWTLFFGPWLRQMRNTAV